MEILFQGICRHIVNGFEEFLIARGKIDLPACQSHDDAVRGVRVGAACTRVFRPLPRVALDLLQQAVCRLLRQRPRQRILDGHRRVARPNRVPVRARVEHFHRLARDVAVLREDVLQHFLHRQVVKRFGDRHIFRRILRQLRNVFRQAPGAVLIRGIQLFAVLRRHGIGAIDNLIRIDIIVETGAVQRIVRAVPAIRRFRQLHAAFLVLVLQGDGQCVVRQAVDLEISIHGTQDPLAGVVRRQFRHARHKPGAVVDHVIAGRLVPDAVIAFVIRDKIPGERVAAFRRHLIRIAQQAAVVVIEVLVIPTVADAYALIRRYFHRQRDGKVVDVPAFVRHVEADRLAARLQRHKDLHIRIGLPSARMRDAGRHAVRGCGRHNRDAVRGTLYAAVGVVARHAQRKLVGARFHDENVVIVEVVARVRAADVLGAVFAAGFCPDSGLVAHGRVAALPVEVLGLDLRHALRRHNRLGLHLDVKVVDIPAFMRCIEPDGLEARIQRHIQIDVGVRLPSACERDCADHALRRRRRHDGHAVRGSFHAAVRVVARHAQAELVGACVFHIDVVVEHVVACIGAAHVLAAPDVAAGFNLDAGLVAHVRIAALFVVVLRLDAGDGISAYNRLSHVADVCQLHGKRHRFGGHDKAIHLIPGNFHHLQCSAVRIHRLDRLHGLSCRQAGDGNRHGLAQSRLCRRAQGCFLPVRHLDRIGLARGCAVDLPELHVVDLHGGVGIAQAIEGDGQLAVLHFHLGRIPLIPAVIGDLHLCGCIAVVAGKLHTALVLLSIGHFHRCVHLVCTLRQPGDRLVQTPFEIALVVEIELIVAAECVRLVHAIAHVGEVVHRPIRGVAAFKAAVRDGDLRHHHGRVAHRDVVQDDVARIACSAGDRQRVLSRVEMDGHRDLIPEPQLFSFGKTTCWASASLPFA